MVDAKKKRRTRWVKVLVVGGALTVGGYAAWVYTPLSSQLAWISAQGLPISTPATSQAQAEPSTLPTVQIQRADLVVSQISASGAVELVDRRPVVLTSGGAVAEVRVKVGDFVRSGEILFTLDTTDLERAVKRAELAVENARNSLEELQQPPTESEVALTKANLLEAQKNLDDVLAGPSEAEIAAARASLAAAQAAYNELIAGPSQDKLTQLAADLKKAEVTLAQAQSAYNQIAWRSDAAASSEAAELQSATIDYEKAKAAYAEATAVAKSSEVQSALANIHNAQVQLDALLNSPTEAEIATAQAQVADAQQALDDLLAGPTETELRSAQITLEQALIDLEEAYAALDAATVRAPVDGVVVTLNVAVGEQASAGSEAVVLADLEQLQLTVNVSELDIARVRIGQQAQVELDAFPGQTFQGEVIAIAPLQDSSSSAVTYPVTIRLSGVAEAGVRPGMNAVASFIDETISAGTSWLVPTNSIRQQDGVSIVRVVRDGQPLPIQVTPGAVQGEWTIVRSDELREGDQVLGSVASYLNQNNNRFPMMGGMMGGPPPGGGNFPRPNN
ncbi:MAG: efflux RND transporter periplasmic adaptor subunit [Caldilinea sp.]|nr:efflux RND transporter periplasmic adaptor subunit [Caldilinea sp.]MDW8441347.1 efflux RND transporter periplasmic adaptor subunit [Caldilineaceae bacterium]